MQECLENYQRNKEWALGLSQLYLALRPQVTDALDLTDILRGSLVFAVSAFDAFVHDLVLDGMAAIFDGRRPPTTSSRQQRQNAANHFGVDSATLEREQFLFFVQQRNDLLSFQSVKAVKNAVRSIIEQDVWEEISKLRKLERQDLEGHFELVIQRRHIIVHRADILPVLGGLRNSIDSDQVASAQGFLSALAEDIASVCRVRR